MINNGAIISLTEKISMIAKVTTEDFIIETIEPYCSEVAEIKISKEELKRIILKNYSKPKTVIGNDVFNKIRAEILEEKECAYADFERYKVEYLGQDWEDVLDSLPQDDFRYGMERALEIIHKHIAERGDKEC